MKNRRYASSHGERGFSLIEILVALVLLAGILSALATVTSQWLPNWNRGFVHVQRTELFAQGLERLVADLAAAEFVTANGKSKQPLFEGEELAVRFVRPAIGPNARPGLEVVQIATTGSKQGLALVRTRTPFLPLPADGKISDVSDLSDPVVLMRAPYRTIFSYAGPDHLWQGNWNDADHLPSEIRISVRDVATEQVLAVSTATVVRVNAPAECARSQKPKECIYPTSKALTVNSPTPAPPAVLPK
jgi:general secretion pathway protein J